MSDYLTYTLWRQREQSLPRELELRRVVEERLARTRSRQDEVRPEPAVVPDASAEPCPEPSASVREADLERVN